jgi:Ca2+/Na+ antiporter
MILIGILIGMFIFALYMALYAILNKAYKINPLLHLGGFYIMVEVLDKAILKAIPESYKTKQIEAPFQLDGPIGFIFRLNQPKMSVYDIAMTVLITCFFLFFIYNVGIKQYIKKKKLQEKSNQTRNNFPY